ncbi:MAG: hypothetical protein LBG11_06695, partial [Bifidobacteriaceae bacterium]|nr:hypothetical protein [Bifidobacteriaceae bacterium]
AYITVYYTDEHPPTYATWRFTVKAEVFEHVALGDSFAAGEGNPDYIDEQKCTYRVGWGPFGYWETDMCMESKEDIDFMCHRSQENWPNKVYTEAYQDYLETEATWYAADGKLNFQACSGATATQVVVATYPRLFDGSGRNPFDCGALNNYFSSEERAWINEMSDTMAGVIWSQAPKSGLIVADTRNYFSGRGVCSPDESAINGLMFGRDDEDFSEPIMKVVGLESGSFHPNAAGMELYAQAVNYARLNLVAAIGSSGSASSSVQVATAVQVSPLDYQGADDVNPDWFAGVVDDPESVLSAYSPDVIESVRTTTFVDLYADHKITSSFAGTKCGAVVPNELVPLSADGFAPGSTARVTVTTSADGTTQEVVSAQFTADSDGVLHDELALPGAIKGEYVLMEVSGRNDQGGLAYGNTFL